MCDDDSTMASYYYENSDDFCVLPDDVDLEQPPNPIEEAARQGLWITREGQRIPIVGMTDRHLLNSRRLLERHGVIGDVGVRARLLTPCDVYEESEPRYSPYVDLLDAEIRRRGL